MTCGAERRGGRRRTRQ